MISIVGQNADWRRSDTVSDVPAFTRRQNSSPEGKSPGEPFMMIYLLELSAYCQLPDLSQPVMT